MRLRLVDLPAVCALGLTQEFLVWQVHMLLLAFMERAEGEIPEVLKADLKFLLERAPRLLAELMNVAVYPRRQVFLYGWMVSSMHVLI